MTPSQALFEAGIAELPVSLEQLAEYYNIKVVDYEAYCRIYQTEFSEVCTGISPYGFSFFDEERFLCVVNGSACGKMRRRWTLAHEISHVLLGHISAEILPHSEQCERETERFAAGLLAPLDILQFCGVSSAEEIARLCGLSAQAASYRYGELMKLRRQHTAIRRSVALGKTNDGDHTAFFAECDSRRLFNSFLPFIADYLSERARHDGYENYVKRLKNGVVTAEL